MINGTEISNGVGFPPIEIIIALGTIATAVILGITLYLQVQDRKPKFRFCKNLVGDNRWTIVVFQSDKLIQELTVEINGELMVERGTNQTKFNLGINEGATFIVPENSRDDSEVIFKYDGNKRKIKLGKILSCR